MQPGVVQGGHATDTVAARPVALPAALAVDAILGLAIAGVGDMVPTHATLTVYGGRVQTRPARAAILGRKYTREHVPARIRDINTDAWCVGI